ncbi:hypothetical protein ACN28S_62830 [Cystobacter fuscus]
MLNNVLFYVREPEEVLRESLAHRRRAGASSRRVPAGARISRR